MAERAAVVAGHGPDQMARRAQLRRLRDDRADRRGEEELAHPVPRQVARHHGDDEEPDQLLQQLRPADHQDPGPDLPPVHRGARLRGS
jgi:hypothetical protein